MSLYHKKRAYLAWDGYRFDLGTIKCVEECRTIVAEEKNTDNRTSNSNWSGQLYSFIRDIKSGDFALIPSYNSEAYTLVKIVGEYTFEVSEAAFCHYREIEVIEKEVPKTVFSQHVLYSLGAYRTILSANTRMK